MSMFNAGVYSRSVASVFMSVHFNQTAHGVQAVKCPRQDCTALEWYYMCEVFSVGHFFSNDLMTFGDLLHIKNTFVYLMLGQIMCKFFRHSQTH